MYIMSNSGEARSVVNARAATIRREYAFACDLRPIGFVSGLKVDVRVSQLMSWVHCSGFLATRAQACVGDSRQEAPFPSSCPNEAVRPGDQRDDWIYRMNDAPMFWSTWNPIKVFWRRPCRSPIHIVACRTSWPCGGPPRWSELEPSGSVLYEGCAAS